MSFSGPTKSEDLFAQGRRGGLRNIPYCGVISGLAVSLRSTGAALTPTSTSLALDIVKGSAKFDNVILSLPSDITTGSVTVPAMSAGESVVRDIYLRPTRKVPVTTSVPTGGNDGDMRLHVSDQGSYHLLINVYKKVSGSWVVYDPVNEPPTQDHLGLPLNSFVSTLTIDNFSGEPEKPVYRSYSSSISSPRPGLVLVRAGLSLRLARVTMTLAGTYTFGTTAPTNPTIINYDNMLSL